MSSRAESKLSLDRFCKTLVGVSALSILLWALPVKAAMDPRFELDPQALGVSSGNKTSAVKTKVRAHNQRHRKSKGIETVPAGGTVHVVKAGDNLFKILIRDYALSNDEAEAFVEEIRRENNIYDIRRLKIGQKVIIPAIRRRADGTLKIITATPPPTASSGTIGQSFRLESPISSLSEQEACAKFRQTWDRILPPLKGGQKPVMLESPTFSLALDPQLYPVFATMNNGRILLDQNASIPPLVKTLIAEKDPSIRIVSESPNNGKRFLATMLGSAGFYSVEENFSLDFGIDPKLTVHSDFKIEKTTESLINQDIILLNSGRVPLPLVIGNLLKKEGFTVYEPFAALQPVVPVKPRAMYQITTKNPSDIIDALLSSFSITPDKDKRLDVFAADKNGISLSVKAERYFERGGLQHVVTRFDGDPVTYTLFRILETKGYQVTILDAQDDFRKITERLLTRMHIQGTYSLHTLDQEDGVNYSLQLSGYKLEGAGGAAGLFLTNLELDRVIRDIITANGYVITSM